MGRSSLAAIALLLGAVLAHAGPLHEAAGAGDVDKVRRLLAEGEDIGEMQALGTPLHWAALKGRLEVAEVLVAEGAKVDEPAGSCASRLCIWRRSAAAEMWPPFCWPAARR